MSIGNKPLKKDQIVNDDENMNIEPEIGNEEIELDEESDNLDDEDTGGSNPPPNKERP